jgi:hypothetical protein
MSVEIAAPPRTLRRVTHSATRSIPSINLYEVTPDTHHRLRVVSKELCSVWVHQSGRRPLPCYSDSDSACPHHRLPLKQHHYLFVELPEDPTLRLVRLTSGLVYQVLPELTDPAKNLNGLMIELWRQNSAKYDSPLLGKILTEECVTNVIRDTPDIEWAVQRMLAAPDRLKPWTKNARQSMRPRVQPAATSQVEDDPDVKSLKQQQISAAAKNDWGKVEMIGRLLGTAGKGGKDER